MTLTTRVEALEQRLAAADPDDNVRERWLVEINYKGRRWVAEVFEWWPERLRTYRDADYYHAKGGTWDLEDVKFSSRDPLKARAKAVTWIDARQAADDDKALRDEIVGGPYQETFG